jgi:hypothetical protein
MSQTSTGRHALAETVAEYGASKGTESVTKLSISLPTPLLDEVRATAAGSGQSVSGVIAAAIRAAIAHDEQAHLDAAIEEQNEENLAFAQAYLPIAAQLFRESEW